MYKILSYALIILMWGCISKADIKKAMSILKWKPRIKIKDGIKIMLSNLDYWKNAPVWNKKSISIATKVWFELLK